MGGEGGGGGGGGGHTGHYGFCHIMRHAVMILFLFFIKDRSSLQYFRTEGMGQSSFLTFRTICNFRGRTSAIMKPA